MVAVGKALEFAHMVNAEYGLSDRNDYTDGFIKRLWDYTKAEVYDYGYLWYMIVTDDWGYKCMSVMSYYILPDKRSAKNFIKLQHRIETIAKLEKVKYIEQGSHLNPKVNDILVRFGYKQAVLRKEL